MPYPALLMDAVYDDTDRAQLAFESSAVRAQVSYARVLHWMTDEYRVSGAPAPRGWSMSTLATPAPSEGASSTCVGA